MRSPCAPDRAASKQLYHYAFVATDLKPALQPRLPQAPAILWELLPADRALHPRPAVWLTSFKTNEGRWAATSLALTYGPGVRWRAVPETKSKLCSALAEPDRENRIWPSFGRPGGAWETLLVEGTATTDKRRALPAEYSEWRQEESFLLSRARVDTMDALAALLDGADASATGPPIEEERQDSELSRDKPHWSGNEPPRVPLPERFSAAGAVSRAGGVTLLLEGLWPAGPCISLSTARCQCRHEWSVWASVWEDHGPQRLMQQTRVRTHICDPSRPTEPARAEAEVRGIARAAWKAIWDLQHAPPQVAAIY